MRTQSRSLLLPLSWLALWLVAIPNNASAQTEPAKTNPAQKTVRVVPGPEYDAGGMHRFFFGDLWRNLWATEIEVEVLDMATFAGGLKPTKRGGGFQTKSLRFVGGDGHEYKFRSLNKDPRKVLPKALQESIVADIVQDLISTSNPVSPLVAAPILDAQGVLNTAPRIVVLPDDERLGEFRADFGGLLGMLEENPTAEEDVEGFAGADKIQTTYKFFRRLDDDNDNQVDARAFLRARLLDVFMGDWDRHVDQWQWARFREEDNDKLWRPIPRDRDQAFCRYNGLIPSLAEMSVAQLEGCEDEYPKIADLTWSGRYLDRKFLSAIDRPTWDSIASDVAAKLTDEVIDNAVRQMPPQMYQKEGAALANTLRARRDGFRAAATEFYLNMAKVVEIRGSNKGEYLEVARRGDDATEVWMFKRDKTTGEKKGDDLLFHRLFNNHETRELRIFLFDGDDKAVVTGQATTSPIVRVVGGDGQDELIDSSRVEGYFLSITPIPDAEITTYFYDEGKKTTVVEGPSTCYNSRQRPLPANDTLKYEPPVEDRGHDWRFGPMYGYNSDEGVLLGGGPILYEFGFDADPYVYRLDLRVGYATANRFNTEFTSDFYTLIPGAHFSLNARASGLDVLKFFGIGNETAFNHQLADEGFYKVRQQQYSINPELGFPLFPNAEMHVGAEYKFIHTEQTNTENGSDSTFLGTEPTPRYGTEDIAVPKIYTGLTLDTRNSTAFPTSGLFVDLKGSYSPKFGKLRDDMVRLQADARLYLSAKFLTLMTLALRVGGEQVWGEYPFFEAAFLGGDATLRGFDKNRFAGNTSAFGNAELRAYLFKVKLLVPHYVGFFLTADGGKVFAAGEQSTVFHRTVGGGLWVAPVSPDNVFSIGYAKSESEDGGIYFTTGFMF